MKVLLNFEMLFHLFLNEKYKQYEDDWFHNKLLPRTKR